MNVILEGVVGSTAYGLATPDSDIDKLGIFLAPTRSVLGFGFVPETETSHDPDTCHHELRKFLHLALNANPTILELLFLPEYTVSSSIGRSLVAMREAFLSARVRQTYGGYASQQFLKLQKRGDFGSKMKKRYEKHVRHCWRLLTQGAALLETGTLTVKLDDPDFYHRIGKLPPDELIPLFREAYAKFEAVPCVLPPKPNQQAVSDFLVKVRIEELRFGCQ